MASRYPLSLIVCAIAVVACGPVQRPTPTLPRPTQQIALPPATTTLPVTATPTRTNTPVVIRATPTSPRPTTRATSTRTPTRRPTASHTAPVASPSPTVASPTSTATATATQVSLRYKSANKGCAHSGQTFIQGTIYRGSDRVNGVTVVMSGFPEGAIVAQRVSGTDGDGFYSMIVEAGGSANGQKRWVWVVESSQRASDVVQFDFNNLKASDPAACWRGFVDFVQQY